MSYFFFKEAGNPELYMKISSVLYIGNKFECHDIKKYIYNPVYQIIIFFDYEFYLFF